MTREALLRFALIAFGAVFCLVYPLAIIWPSGWAWHEGPPEGSQYFMMIVGVYATLGVFLIRAASNPSANRSLILFTIVSSIEGHLLGDVPALILVALVLSALMPQNAPS
jgi:hypothetical protein